MKTKKEEVISFLQQHKEKYTTIELAKYLNMQRSNISSILNQLVKENKVEKLKGKPVFYRLNDIHESQEMECFYKLVGYNDSLKNAVQSAKAAILYPGNPLSVLIIGQKGTGKSYFSSIMYDFAIKHNKTNISYVKINCRNYNDNDDEYLNSIFYNDKTSKACMLLIM